MRATSSCFKQIQSNDKMHTRVKVGDIRIQKDPKGGLVQHGAKQIHGSCKSRSSKLCLCGGVAQGKSSTDPRSFDMNGQIHDQCPNCGGLRPKDPNTQTAWLWWDSPETHLCHTSGAIKTWRGAQQGQKLRNTTGPKHLLSQVGIGRTCLHVCGLENQPAIPLSVDKNEKKVGAGTHESQWLWIQTIFPNTCTYISNWLHLRLRVMILHWHCWVKMVNTYPQKQLFDLLQDTWASFC